MTHIPIVISGDDNIFFTIAVVIVSLAENANADTFYDIQCLCAGDVTDENKKKLELLKNRYSNFSLTFHDLKDTFKDIITTDNYHVNYVSAYKMLIPSMFPQYDKVLYLDTDILVRGDLTEFYNFDLEDNYLAGVPVFVNIIPPNMNKYFTELLEIPNMDFYINAGVMLMNLKKIREDNIDKKWISLLGSYEKSVDQHIINKVCYGKTRFVSLKWNVCFSALQFYLTNELSAFYSIREYKQAFDNPTIFHWTGEFKPWKYEDTFLAHEWFRYFLKTGFDLDLLKRGRCKKIKSLISQKIVIPKPAEVVDRVKYTLFGIPIWKTRIEKHRKRHYLFGIIKFLTEKSFK